MADQITNYKCPACTGPLQFKGSSGQMECEYCGSTYGVDEIEKLYEEANDKAVDAKAKADAKDGEVDWEYTSSEWKEDGIKAYNCPSCGAELLCDDNTAAGSCPYCGNPTVVPGQFAGTLKPDFVVPFKLDKEHAISALKSHYKGKPLLPKSFTDGNHIEEIKGVYVPFWLYDGTSDGNVLFEATKSHSRRRGKEEVTITEYYDVVRAGNMAFEKIPADASSKMPDDLMDSIEPYDYKDMKPFSKAYLTGYMADKYDVEAKDNAGRAITRATESTKRAFERDIQGFDTISVKKANINVEQGKVSYAMMPVWMLNTKWNGQDYLFAMNGQTGKMVGDLPSDKKKAATIAAIILLVITALAYFAFEASFVGALIAGAIVAGIVTLVLNSMMKSVALATEADNYLDDGSVKITHRAQRFTHKTETTRTVD